MLKLSKIDFLKKRDFMNEISNFRGVFRWIDKLTFSR